MKEQPEKIIQICATSSTLLYLTDRGRVVTLALSNGNLTYVDCTPNVEAIKPNK